MIYGKPICRPPEGEKDMAELVRDVMTPHPVALPATATSVEAALALHDFAIGEVLVLDDGQVLGIITDRPLVLRGMANVDYPTTVKFAEICSRELTIWSPTARVEDVVSYTREKTI